MAASEGRVAVSRSVTRLRLLGWSGARIGIQRPRLRHHASRSQQLFVLHSLLLVQGRGMCLWTGTGIGWLVSTSSIGLRSCMMMVSVLLPSVFLGL